MNKKLMYVFSLIAIAILASAVAIAAPAYRQSPGTGDILGQGKYESDPHKTFRLVRYVPAAGSNDSGTLAKYSIVKWDTLSDDGVTVTTTTTSGDNAVAGIMVIACLTPELGTRGNTAVQDSGNRNWGWIQTYGLSTALVAQGTEGILSSAGLAFGTSTTAGDISAFAQSATVGASLKEAGFTYDVPSSATAGTEVEVFVRLE